MRKKEKCIVTLGSVTITLKNILCYVYVSVEVYRN